MSTANPIDVLGEPFVDFDRGERDRRILRCPEPQNEVDEAHVLFDRRGHAPESKRINKIEPNEAENEHNREEILSSPEGDRP